MNVGAIIISLFVALSFFFGGYYLSDHINSKLERKSQLTALGINEEMDMATNSSLLDQMRKGVPSDVASSTSTSAAQELLDTGSVKKLEKKFAPKSLKKDLKKEGKLEKKVSKKEKNSKKGSSHHSTKKSSPGMSSSQKHYHKLVGIHHGSSSAKKSSSSKKTTRKSKTKAGNSGKKASSRGGKTSSSAKNAPLIPDINLKGKVTYNFGVDNYGPPDNTDELIFENSAEDLSNLFFYDHQFDDDLETKTKKEIKEHMGLLNDRERYIIQAGAFKDPHDAYKLTESLKEKGFNAYYEKGKFKRHAWTFVRIGKFKSEDSAEKEAEKIRTEEHVRPIVYKAKE